MKLEEFLKKRKEEDGINEFDRGKMADNTRICVDYVLEYFNSYLCTTEGEEKAALFEKKIREYSEMVDCYSDDVRKWLVDMYSSYGKALNPLLTTYIRDPYYLLYDSETEFRALLYDICPEIIKRHRFLDGQEEMIYRFIKDYHRVRGRVSWDYRFPYITESINDWIKETYKEHGVNIHIFCSEYMFEFIQDPNRWPKGHRIKTGYYDKYRNSDIYKYDYKQKENLFGIDALYRDMPEKEFFIGKKQELEGVLMFCYFDEWDGSKQDWIEYSERLT